MNLYVWRPSGHGQYTFSVMADSKAEAFKQISNHIKANYIKEGKLKYEADGWGTEYYQLEVLGPGQVAENENY